MNIKTALQLILPFIVTFGLAHVGIHIVLAMFLGLLSSLIPSIPGAIKVGITAFKEGYNDPID